MDAPEDVGRQEGRGLTVRRVPLSALVEDPRNARTHDERNLEGIRRSLQDFGQREPLVVRDGVVIGGNGRLRVMREMGWTDCLVTEHDDLTEGQARALGIVLNRTAEVGTGWDAEALRLAVEEVELECPEVELGFEAGELAEIGVSEPAEPDEPGDLEPPAPEPQPESLVRPGDVIHLGPHRVMCGSSAEPEQLAKLMGGQRAQMVVTSPPYWGLRDYGTAEWEGGDPGCDHLEPPRGGRNPETAGKQLSNAGTLTYQYAGACEKCGARRVDEQLGLEETPEEFLASMVSLFGGVRDVLRDDGTLWCNMGDCFNDKQLAMIPARLAIALQADGWWLRSDIIWAKPNPMPESCRDRPTSAHEHIFLLAKRGAYYWDQEAVREGWADERCGAPGGHKPAERNRGGRTDGFTSPSQAWEPPEGRSGRNLRNVWTLPTSPCPEAHFATYPLRLAERCILAGTSERGCCPECGAPWERVVEKASGGTTGESWSREWDDDPTRANPGCEYGSYQRGHTTGWRPSCEHDADPVPCVVLDPFMGAGTTILAADQCGQIAVGMELSPAYCDVIVRRWIAWCEKAGKDPEITGWRGADG